MASPIKYSDIYLYSTINADSAKYRSYLDSNLINYVNLNYADEEGKTATLAALSTWFDDLENPGQKIQFTQYPILVFESVYWESEDGKEKHQKRTFAVKADDLPSDFLDKATKLT